MKKFNKLVSAAVATAMVMGTVVPTMAYTGTVPTEDGTYTTDSVMAYQYYPYLTGTTVASMCNGVFAAEADIEISGDDAILKLYVCNPTPTWGGLDTGILSNAAITVDGVEYAGELTSIGTIDADAAVKPFSQDSSFFGISAGESYACDTMEFTIPKTALAGTTTTYNGNDIEHDLIAISAFVNLVMNSEQDFFLDLNYADAPEVTSQTMDITATVPANVATYDVTIPQSVEMGELSTTEDTVVSYEVEVDADNISKSITVETTDATLTDASGSVSLALVNAFGEEGVATFAESGTTSGSLTVAAADVAKIATDAAQSLTGSITFTITAK
ncbi:hypothetical protein [Chakrabartyella piscis]|uniref:hypothetical protein n=1 Tax=Chakrabartyella piscis TaxID=2918914 RepID=UPI002958AC1F|nr:hypothetical protein [Chakrabartyella piscis]